MGAFRKGRMNHEMKRTHPDDISVMPADLRLIPDLPCCFSRLCARAIFVSVGPSVSPCLSLSRSLYLSRTRARVLTRTESSDQNFTSISPFWIENEGRQA